MTKFPNIGTKIALLLYYGNIRKPEEETANLTAWGGEDVLAVQKDRP